MSSRETTGYQCAASCCDREGSVWAYSPRVDGLVSSCIYHALDLTVGASEINNGAHVIERGVTA